MLSVLSRRWSIDQKCIKIRPCCLPSLIVKAKELAHGELPTSGALRAGLAGLVLDHGTHQSSMSNLAA